MIANSGDASAATIQLATANIQAGNSNESPTFILGEIGDVVTLNSTLLFQPYVRSGLRIDTQRLINVYINSSFFNPAESPSRGVVFNIPNAHTRLVGVNVNTSLISLFSGTLSLQAPGVSVPFGLNIVGGVQK